MPAAGRYAALLQRGGPFAPAEVRSLTPVTHSSPTTTGSVEQAGHDVDDEGHDHRPEQVRQQSMGERDSSNRLRRKVRIGYLKCHPDGQGQVGEVQIVG